MPIEKKQRTSWGSTQGPVYSNPSNGERNVWSEQYVASQNYKTVYVYYRYRTPSSTASSSPTSWGNYTVYETFKTDSPLAQYPQAQQDVGVMGYKYWHSSTNFWVVFYSGTEHQWVSDNYATRWYYQEPVYTYYYYKDLDKETFDSDPTGQADVSNVQHLVQYRAR